MFVKNDLIPTITLNTIKIDVVIIMVFTFFLIMIFLRSNRLTKNTAIIPKIKPITF